MKEMQFLKQKKGVNPGKESVGVGGMRERLATSPAWAGPGQFGALDKIFPNSPGLNQKPTVVTGVYCTAQNLNLLKLSHFEEAFSMNYIEICIAHMS